MYSIYHIKGVKIGVSTNVKRRVKEQGYTIKDVEVLEEHTDIYEVSRREIILQEQHGYIKDCVPYFSTILKFQLKGSKMGNSKENRKKANESLKRTIKEKGLHKGEKNARAKLTKASVVKIRKLYESGKITNKAELGRMFNITDSMIRYIVQYKNWN